jgi:hypothetical protein
VANRAAVIGTLVKREELGVLKVALK